MREATRRARHRRLVVRSMQGLWLLLLVLFALGPAASVHAQCADVLFVRNNGPGGSGGPDDPLLVLPQFPDPTVDVIYLYTGTGSAINQNTGIFLSAGQKLIGESIGYQDDCNDIPPTQTQGRPVITSSTNASILLLGDNEVAGIRIQSDFVGAGILATGIPNMSFFSDANIHDNQFDGSNLQLIYPDGVLRIADNEFSTPPGVGIAITHQGAPLELTIEGNRIEDASESGIFVGSFSEGPIGTVTIRENTVVRSDNEGIELDDLNALVTIERNTIQDGRDTGIDLFDVGGQAIIRQNDLDDIDDEGIVVELPETTSLLLEVLDNSDDDSRDEVFDNFGGGIALVTRDSADLNALVGGNHVHDGGGSGISIFASESSSIATRVASNDVQDARQNGVALDASENAWIRSIVEQNQVLRSGGIGIRTSFSTNALQQELRVIDNDIDDSGEDGITIRAAGTGAHQLNAELRDNQIFDGLERGVAIDFAGAFLGEFTLQLSSNQLVGNADEGVRIDVSRPTNVDIHLLDNLFSANADLYAVNAIAGASSRLCSALIGNEADNDYRLVGARDSIHIYEDTLSTNLGDFLLEDMEAETFGAVGKGSCHEIDIGPLPVGEYVPVPEPRAVPLGVAALACLAALVAARRPRAISC